ncbi:MAG: hypothetical protein ABG776_21895 [Cyanobacteria bacterium J06555_13]
MFNLLELIVFLGSLSMFLSASRSLAFGIVAVLATLTCFVIAPQMFSTVDLEQ